MLHTTVKLNGALTRAPLSELIALCTDHLRCLWLREEQCWAPSPPSIPSSLNLTAGRPHTPRRRLTIAHSLHCKAFPAMETERRHQIGFITLEKTSKDHQSSHQPITTTSIKRCRGTGRPTLPLLLHSWAHGAEATKWQAISTQI